jgi:peptidoglycan/xylan/chitin deacetylase (PgdA/CDA1 family)
VIFLRKKNIIVVLFILAAFALSGCKNLKGFDGKMHVSAPPSASPSSTPETTPEEPSPPEPSPATSPETSPETSPTAETSPEISPGTSPTADTSGDGQASPTPAQTSTPQTVPEPSPSGGTTGAETTFRRASSPNKVAYLTIDDGPSYENTPKILDILKENGIHATFFPLPRDGADELYRRIIAEGHTLGNHTFSHNYKLLYNPEDVDAFRDDVLKMRDFIMARFNYSMTIFRFPGGTMGRSREVMVPRRTVMQELGYSYFDWDVSLGDAAGDESALDVNALVQNVLNGLGKRDKVIILMHDSAGKTATPEALERIIKALRERGYLFDTLEHY